MYFCFKVSPVSARLQGHTEVLHLLPGECTGKTSPCFVNALYMFSIAFIHQSTCLVGVGQLRIHERAHENQANC